MRIGNPARRSRKRYRSSAPQSIAAVQALGEARTPAAQNALQHLLDDKDKEVKQAVFRLLMQTGAKEG